MMDTITQERVIKIEGMTVMIIRYDMEFAFLAHGIA